MLESKIEHLTYQINVASELNNSKTSKGSTVAIFGCDIIKVNW